MLTLCNVFFFCYVWVNISNPTSNVSSLWLLYVNKRKWSNSEDSNFTLLTLNITSVFKFKSILPSAQNIPKILDKESNCNFDFCLSIIFVDLLIKLLCYLRCLYSALALHKALLHNEWNTINKEKKCLILKWKKHTAGI